MTTEPDITAEELAIIHEQVDDASEHGNGTFVIDIRDMQRILAEIRRLTAELADARDSMAMEVKCNLDIFAALGLHSEEDFGCDTSTEAVCKRVQSLVTERDRLTAENERLKAALWRISYQLHCSCDIATGHEPECAVFIARNAIAGKE